MRVGIVSNNLKSIHCEQETNFKGNRNPVTSVLDAFEIIKRAKKRQPQDSPEVITPKVVRAVRGLLSIASDAFIEIAKFCRDNKPLLEQAKRIIKSKKVSTEEKQKIIDKVLEKVEKRKERTSEFESVKDFVVDKLASFVISSRDKKLAEYLLQKTQDATPVDKRKGIRFIIERVELLEKLGSKDNLKELQEYNEQRAGEKEMTDLIGKAIEKLQTNPNF